MIHAFGKLNLSGFFIAIIVLTITTSSIKAQEDSSSVFDRELSIQIRNTQLYRALIEISDKINHNFSYDSDILDGEKKVSLNLQNQKLRLILDSLLQNPDLRYDVYNKHIIIYKKSEKPQQPKYISDITPQGKNLIKLTGKIVDEKNKEPLSYCNVGLVNILKGTVSNLDGEFLLKIKPEYVDDSLIVTYIGYKNKVIPVKDFMNGENTIYLERKSYTIQEVIVRWTDPYSVVTESISRINKNYFQEPLILTSFYREVIKKEEDYTTISEAVMKIYKAYNKVFQTDQIKVLKSRKSVSYSKEDNVLVKLKSGLEAVLLLDVINQNISFLNSIQLNNYQFDFKGITYFNDHDTYEISFSPKKEVDFPLYSGTLFIDLNSLAIVATEFHLDNENLDKIANSLVIKKKWDLRVKPKQAKYTVNYRQLDNKYYLNHIRGELIFKVRKKNELISEEYNVSFEMLSSDIDTTVNENFKYSETTRPHKIFIEEIKGYDPEFWGQYNYILPDEPIRETLNKMTTQIKMLHEEE